VTSPLAEIDPAAAGVAAHVGETQAEDAPVLSRQLAASWTVAPALQDEGPLTVTASITGAVTVNRSGALKTLLSPAVMSVMPCARAETSPDATSTEATSGAVEDQAALPHAARTPFE